jgi:hypothetical protein
MPLTAGMTNKNPLLIVLSLLGDAPNEPDMFDELGL